MSRLKVNVKVAGKTYHLSVENTLEEESLRIAETKIRDSITKLESSYEIGDKQDVLAMIALQFISESELSVLKKSEKDDLVSETLEELITLVDDKLH